MIVTVVICVVFVSKKWSDDDETLEITYLLQIQKPGRRVLRKC